MSPPRGEGGASRKGARRPADPKERVYAALDLGTNNCRLLVAAAAPGGFRVIDSFSRIVRLGEGVASAGQLSDAAIARTLEALKACAQTVAIHPNLKIDCIATQACRAAANGEAFLDQVRRETGFAFRIVSAAEEARLAARGCASLIDPRMEIALVVDVGGGSTELAFVEAATARDPSPHIIEWASLPIGVVELAERLPETGEPAHWYQSVRNTVAAQLASFSVQSERVADAFANGRAHILGTSGAVSSLAGVHLRLERYQRSKVDGLWMMRTDLSTVAQTLLAMGPQGRADNACIGKDRADLVLPGCAILEAICDRWPAERIRVADRGLREGVLMDLIDADRRASTGGQP
jgi:exopolyphosphatase/guanosine-5'-triphosphate,3'-diphosphate pyrophosphatase